MLLNFSKRDRIQRLDTEKDKELMVGSLDVEALYPSIDQKEGPKLVSEEVRKSRLKFEGINYRLTAVYLTSTMTPERQEKEGIRKLIPHSVPGFNNDSRDTREGRGKETYTPQEDQN